MTAHVDIPRGPDADEFSRVEHSPAWWPFLDTETGGGVMIRCDCGELLSIDVKNKWRIDEGGNVRESILHTRGGAKGSDVRCGWHVFARLLDWPFGRMGS